jgi:hypothetical protein
MIIGGVARWLSYFHGVQDSAGTAAAVANRHWRNNIHQHSVDARINPIQFVKRFLWRIWCYTVKFSGYNQSCRGFFDLRGVDLEWMETTGR